jgi:hypothetical protein
MDFVGLIVHIRFETWMRICTMVFDCTQLFVVQILTSGHDTNVCNKIQLCTFVYDSTQSYVVPICNNIYIFSSISRY